MAFFFGDGFDLYATGPDAIGHWDASSANPSNMVISAGRFAGSRGGQVGSATRLDKVSGSNDPVHHLVFAYTQQTAISGSSLGAYFTFCDGATAQCSIVMRTDGAILLTSGAFNGTVLATYPGAFSVINTWYAYEIEVVIHNTNGSVAIRKNGNTANDFFLGSLDTAVTANNYANKLQHGSGPVTFTIDDFLWRSDTTVPWVGDVRCYTRMPLADVGTPQWTKTGGRSAIISGGNGFSSVADRAYYGSFIMPCDGTIAAIIFSVATATYTGSLKNALYNDNSGVPGTVIQSAANIITAPPVIGNVTFNYSPVIPVVAGQRIWMGTCQSNATGGIFSLGTSSGGFINTVSYATFPVSNPSSLSASGALTSTIMIVPTSNAALVNEAQQDANTTIVSASAVGLADFYTIASMASTPANVLGITTRGYFTKSDAGARNVAVQLKSGAATVQTPSITLTTSGWSWAERTDVVDPATGVAWTAIGANNINIGPIVTA